MLILEEPYISRELAEFAARSGEAVLDNASAREAEKNFNVSFNLLDDAAFAERCSRGERLYTNSENALDWLYTYSKNQELIAQVERLKDKVSMRRALAPLYPDYSFRELTLEEVLALDANDLVLPCVLKPSVGFCSLGVYCIENEGQWQHAKDDIAANVADWCRQYPAAVLGDNKWIVESLIQGTEYAVDVYFDDAGRAVVCLQYIAARLCLRTGCERQALLHKRWYHSRNACSLGRVVQHREQLPWSQEFPDPCGA